MGFDTPGRRIRPDTCSKRAGGLTKPLARFQFQSIRPIPKLRLPKLALDAHFRYSSKPLEAGLSVDQVFAL